MGMHKRPVCVDNQQARTVARAGWPKGDPFFREIEIELIDAHERVSPDALF
jgi:hypothetical protein